MSKKRLEIIGMLLITLGVLMLLSLISYNPQEEPTISQNVIIKNWMGIAGIFISHLLMKYTIGVASFVFPILILLWGWWLFAKRDKKVLLRFSIYLVIMSIIVSIALAIPTVSQNITVSYGFRYSGFIGGVIAKTLFDFLGLTGIIIFISGIALVTIRGYFSWNFYGPFEWIFAKKNQKQKKIPSEDKKKSIFQKLFERKDKESKEVTPAVKDLTPKELLINKDDRPENPPIPLKKKLKKQNKETDLKFSVDEEITEEVNDSDKSPKQRNTRQKFQLPDVNLLAEIPDQSDNVDEDEMRENARLLEESLATFKVDGRVVHVSPGPVVTQYEVEPGKGVRISKIAALADDLARILKAKRIRIVAPIPGKSVVGIEIPNRKQAMIYLKSIIACKKYKKVESKLTLALGKTISGEVFMTDLAKMPHLLIAGATGAGKSVCLNTIITSILYKAKPDEVKFMMIDPKKLELSAYKALIGFHLIQCEDLDEYVVTKPDNAIVALKSIELEMERRYDILAGATVRNLTEYNTKIVDGVLDQEHLPYIVVVIDELADLMLTSAKEVEEPITRLAQMARAVGIHLVIATQRPSVNVITGVIKANFPARIAFQVASKIDSRTILDFNGAEKLLGRGDMLITTPQHPEPQRLHGAFISLDEIERILGHISSQAKPDEIALPSVQEDLVDEFGEVSDDDRDELYYDALKLVVIHQQGSISLVQRRLKVGYSRAARIIDQLEHGGIVGPFTGSKAREVLVDENYLEDID